MSVQVRQGYKWTEAGVIPNEWSIKRLGDLATVGSGGTPSREKAGYWNGLIPWITTSQIDFNTITYADQFITVEGLQNSAAKLLPAGTLLMALYGQGKTRGKVGVLGIEAATNQACASISLTGGISREFALHFLASRYESIRNSSNTGGQENLNGQIVKDTPVVLPPISEQRAIAAALSDMDALISGLDQLIAKKRNIKQAAMQQLLTGEQRLPGFSGEWKVKRLGEIGVFLKGSGVRRDQSLSGDLPCIRYGEIYTVHNDYIREFKSYISVAVSEDAVLIECGDIMFAGSGETKEDIGKSVSFIDDIEAYAGGDIVILRPKNVDSLFLGYALNTPKISRQKASRGQGDAVVHISASALATIEVLMPNQAEQTAIANILSDMDGELATLETKRNKIRQLKQGAMQQLLSGKIRLSNEDKKI